MTAPTHACLTTPPGKGGIAVIALWGPQAARIVQGVFRPGKSHSDDQADVLRLGHIADDGHVLDEAILCRRGDLYEINIHGGPLVAREVMELLVRQGAEASAATRRREEADAFEPSHPKWNNPAIGREMLAALPSAHSELVVAALSQQWQAGISQLAREILSGRGRPAVGPAVHDPKTRPRNDNNLVASPPVRVAPGLAPGLAQAAAKLEIFRRLLEPCKVVLLGAPNAGKSTLMNAMAARTVSIVHQRPGTTRDWVDELVLLDGVPVSLVDTAGLLDDAQGIDAQAVARARQQAAAADLVLELSEGPCPPLPAFVANGTRLLRVATKCDLCAAREGFDVQISAVTGLGLGELKDAILKALGMANLDIAAPTAFTQRQADLLAQAAEADNRRVSLLTELLEGR